MINETLDTLFGKNDGLELVRLINKEMRGGLAPEEEERKADLIALFKSKN